MKSMPIHRRVQSTALPQGLRPDKPVPLTTKAEKQVHKRSISMPLRRSTYDESESSSSNDDHDSRQSSRSSIAMPPGKVSEGQVQGYPSRQPHVRQSSGENQDDGWWDVISAMTAEDHAPWHDNPRSTTRKRTSSNVASTPPRPSPSPATSRKELGNQDKSPRPSLGQSINPVGQSSFGQVTSDAVERASYVIDLGKENINDDYFGQVDSQYEQSGPLDVARPHYTTSHSEGTPPLLKASPRSPMTTPPLASNPVRSKLGGFGRSMSLAMNRSKKEEKDKENERDRAGVGKKVMNHGTARGEEIGRGRESFHSQFTHMSLALHCISH